MTAKAFLPRACALAALGALAACASPTPVRSTGTPPATPTSSTSSVEIGCSAVNAAPTPGESSVLPPITSADYTRGPADASVTLLAYCDFQSGECELFNRVLDQLVKDHPTDLKVVLRPFPIPTVLVPVLDKSELAAQAALAAGDQGKFWEMRDLLHSHYLDWVKLSTRDFMNWLRSQAEGLKIDVPKFETDLKSPSTQGRVQALYKSAIGVGISAVPTVFINGQLQQRPALSYDGLESTISLIALGARQFKTCPPYDIDPSRQYSAMLHTVKGDVSIRLFAGEAPLAVNSFVFLARQGWFDGVTFHRVIPGFVAQAGDPSGTGSGGPGYLFKNEIRVDLTFSQAGMVGMANSGPDTNGSQFFITLAPEPQLDGSYTIFGQVTAGMDVVESLTPRDPQTSTALPPGDKILSVTIVEN
jgi:cyclophilin family peptidyl-prolyl cis-trans isomerase/protein-disulfide isomerase